LSPAFLTKIFISHMVQIILFFYIKASRPVPTMLYIPHGSDNTFFHTTQPFFWKSIILYIPHGSDNAQTDPRGAMNRTIFISHMVQIIHFTIVNSFLTFVFSLYPTWFR